MGKILDVTPISDIAQMPLKKGTLQFLQDAYNGNDYRILQALSSTNTNFQFNDVYVLYGCKNTGVFPNYNISEGVVLYGLQLFDVPATTFTVSGSDVAVASITQTQYTTDADPVTLTDTSVVNVHNIFGIQIAAGASGSGAKNYSDFIFDEFSIYAERLNRQNADAGLQAQIDYITNSWVAITLDGTNISSGGGSIGSISGNLKYIRNGKTIILAFDFTATLSGTSTLSLGIDLSSFLGADVFDSLFSKSSVINCDNATSSGMCAVYANSAGQSLIIYSALGLNNGTNSFSGSITAEIA
jgi:hypothetical protein